MASEIRVNRLSNRSGLSTITFANGGVQFSGITTFANGEFYVGTGATIINPGTNEFNFHTGGSNRFTINNSGVNLGTGNITAVDATFTGNVSIGKTLTYEDVKNIDSVGVVTARAGVKVTGGDFTVGTAITASSVTGNVTQDVGITTYSGSAVWFKGATANKDMYWSKSSGSLVFKDNAAALFGSNSDLQIYHNGSHSYITEGSGSTPGDLHIQANNLKLRNWDGGQNYLTGTSSGSVELFHDGNKKFETTNTGVSITGIPVATQTTGNVGLELHATGSGRGSQTKYHNDHGEAYVGTAGDTTGNFLVHNSSNSHMLFATNNTERLRIVSGGSVNIGTGELTQTARKFNVYGGAARVTQTAGGNTVEVFGHTASGSSYGLLVNAGSTSGDYAAEFRNKDATTLFRLRGDGKVGINTASPRAVLDIEGNAENATLMLHSNDANANLQFSDNTGGARILNYGGDLAFRTGTNAHVFGTGDNERLRITSAGNIGVAGDTGTDFSLLDGMVVNVGNGSAGILLNSSSSSHNAYLGFSYGSGSSTSHADQFSAYIGRVGDNQLIFGTNNVVRGQVSPTGGLQWGLPGSSSSLPGAHGALNVRALANGNLHVRASSDLQGSTTGVGLDILNDAGNTVQDLVIRGATTYFRNASAETLRIDSNGMFKFTRGSTGTVGHFYANARECNILLQNDAQTWKIVNYDYGNNGTDNLGFHNGSSDIFVIGTNGCLGAGVTQPTEAFHLLKSHNGHTRMVIQNNWGSNATAQLKLISPTDEFQIVKYASGSAQMSLSNNSTIITNIGGAERLKVRGDSTGQTTHLVCTPSPGGNGVDSQYVTQVYAMSGNYSNFRVTVTATSWHSFFLKIYVSGYSGHSAYRWVTGYCNNGFGTIRHVHSYDGGNFGSGTLTHISGQSWRYDLSMNSGTCTHPVMHVELSLGGNGNIRGNGAVVCAIT